MALSGLFLILFLGQHFTINITSVFSQTTFNFISHFMGNNPIVQFILQPILIFGVVFHFDSHAAWECEQRLCRHLPARMRFFHFSTPPEREVQKS